MRNFYIGENLLIKTLNKQRQWFIRWWQAVLRKKALFNPSAWQGLQQQLIAYYQTILSRGEQVQQHLRLNTSLGNMKMDFYAKYPDGLGKFNLQWHWQIAKPLAKLWLYYAYQGLSSKITQMNPFFTAEMSTDALLNRYQALGLLLEQGNSYLSVFHYST